jgi:hypothetical protein
MTWKQSTNTGLVTISFGKDILKSFRDHMIGKRNDKNVFYQTGSFIQL